MEEPTIKPMDRVRTLIPIGHKLPAGSVGVVMSVDAALYPEDTAGKAHVLSVIFPILGNGDAVVYPDTGGLDSKSVPHMNAVPFRLSEVEKVDSLATETPKEDSND